MFVQWKFLIIMAIYLSSFLTFFLSSGVLESSVKLVLALSFALLLAPAPLVHSSR